MKNLLFLLAAAAIYLHFYPNEKVTDFYNEKKLFLASQFEEVGNTKIRLKPSKIYEDLESELDHFSDDEIKRLKNVSSSRPNVAEFYSTYCKTQRRDAVFHITNEKKVCSVISKYQSLL